MTVTAEMAHNTVHAGREGRAWSQLLCAAGLRGPT